MTLRALPSLAALALLSACAGTPPPAARPPVIRAPVMPMVAGLDRVMGSDARGLVALFGPADQDVREGDARKLQFGSAICILDTYLYPPAKGKEPRVTFIDARQNDGATIDKASCVAALTRRKEAR